MQFTHIQYNLQGLELNSTRFFLYQVRLAGKLPDIEESSVDKMYEAVKKVIEAAYGETENLMSAGMRQCKS